MSGLICDRTGSKDPNREDELFGDFWEEGKEPSKDDPEFQDAFLWTCCNQRGGANGCIVTRHSPKSDTENSKRRVEETNTHLDQDIGVKQGERGAFANYHPGRRESAIVYG